MKIAIIGAGAMGSLFGGSLADENEVCLYSRNAAYVDAVQKNGLIMTRLKERKVVHARATSDPAEIGPCDVAIIFVKCTGTKKAMENAMVSCITKDTLVVTLQNGIGNVDTLREFVSDEQIVFGFSTLTSDMTAPGVMEMTTLSKVYTSMAPFSKIVTPKLTNLISSMERVGLYPQLPENIYESIWYKLLVNTSQNTLCAILKLDGEGLMLRTQESFELACSVIYEVTDVARAKGINISREAGLNHVMHVVYAVPHHVPSMAFDVAKKKPTEIDCLNAAVVAEGKRLGVKTPMNEVIVKLIRTIEKNYNQTIDISEH